jgi:ribosome-binding ATPase YchF (GTP1/OBG family)
LQAGKPVRSAGLNAKEQEALKTLAPLTMKPVIFAANVADSDLASGNEMSQKVFEYAAQQGTKAVLVSAQVRLFDDCCTLRPLWQCVVVPYNVLR